MRLELRYDRTVEDMGPAELLLDDEYLQERGLITSVRAAWRDVTRVERDAERTFLFLAPLAAIVVPHRAFASLSERDAFDQVIREHFGNGPSRDSPPGGPTRE